MRAGRRAEARYSRVLLATVLSLAFLQDGVGEARRVQVGCVSSARCQRSLRLLGAGACAEDRSDGDAIAVPWSEPAFWSARGRDSRADAARPGGSSVDMSVLNRQICGDQAVPRLQGPADAAGTARGRAGVGVDGGF